MGDAVTSKRVRWGMTADEIVVVCGPRVRKVEEAEREDLSGTDFTTLAVGELRRGPFEFEVSYRAHRGDTRLKLVRLELQDPEQYGALRESLERRYGQGSSLPPDPKVEIEGIRWLNGSEAITLLRLTWPMGLGTDVVVDYESREDASRRRAADVLAFWFGGAANDPAAAEARMPLWFRPDTEIDAAIAHRFQDLYTEAADGRLECWREAPRSCLALVLLLDQFPRILFRNTPDAFGQDSRALEIARAGVEQGQLESLTPVEQGFFLLPFEHSEDLRVQREGFQLFENLLARAPSEWQPAVRRFLEFSRRHLAVIERFGRFPHRNGILGRQPTAEERSWLESGGERFGTATPSPRGS